MKYLWCLLLLVLVALHALDGDWIRILNFLLWYVCLSAPAVLIKSLGFSWAQSRVLVVPLVCLPIYILLSNTPVPFSGLFWWVIVVVSLFVSWKKRNIFDWYDIFQQERIFLIVFVSFLFLNSFNPALYWGEKPMDLSLLGYFLRLDQGPIIDPWASGTKLQYYSLGYFSWAMPARAANMSLEQAYVYSMSAVAGLMALACYPLFSAYSKKWAGSLSVLVPFLGTLGVLNSLKDHDISKVSFFWAGTRIFDFNHFAEFPFWSFLFSDLHPHVMAYPIFIIAVSAIFKSLEKFPERQTLGTAILALSLLPWINAWDFLLLMPMCFVVLISYGKKMFTKDVFIAVLVIAFFSISAFLSMKSNARSSLITFSESSGMWGLTQHFLLALIASFLVSFNTNNIRLRMAPFVLGLAILIIDRIIVFDRVNTVFKFMTGLGTLLSIFIPLSLIFAKGKWRFLSVTVLCLSLLSSIIFFISRAWQPPFPVKRPSLRGLSFLKYSFPSDVGVIDYLNTVPGTPLILEATGKSFDYQTLRISSYTGLPVWLGWEHHVVLRGKTWEQVMLRKRWVDGMYESTDAIEVYEHLVAKGVQYVVVGPTERASYRAQGISKFENYPELFLPVFEHYSTQLYQVMTK